MLLVAIRFFPGKKQFELTLNANTAVISVMAFHMHLIFLMICGHEMEEELFLESITSL